MNNLRTITLDDGLAQLLDYRGKSPPKSGTGVAVISAKVVKGGRIIQPIEQTIKPAFYPVWMTRGIPDVGDVVLTTEGPMGEVAQLDEQTARFALGQRVVCMRGKRGILDNTYLKFLLMSRHQQEIMASYATGTTVAGISQKSLRAVPVTLPSYAEQLTIGRTLASLDDRIDLNRHMNETLEAMARAIFKDWFVDFGPTRAKMDSRPPYLASKVWELFPEQLDDREKPRGWHKGTIADYALLNSESWTRKTYPDRVEYVDLSGTKWGTIQSVEVHNRGAAPSRAQRILREGDSVVGVVRPGNGSYAFVGRAGLTGSTGFAVLRPKSRDVREFTYLAATAPENIDRLSHLADGAAYPAVRPEVVMATATVLVPDGVRQAFSEATSSLLNRIEANKRESSVLAAMRDLLLPKLMSGEIRVKDAEKQLAAVA